MNKGDFYNAITEWFYDNSHLSNVTAVNKLEATLHKNIELLSEKDAKEMLFHHLRYHALQSYITPDFNPYSEGKVKPDSQEKKI